MMRRARAWGVLLVALAFLSGCLESREAEEADWGSLPSMGSGEPVVMRTLAVGSDSGYLDHRESESEESKLLVIEREIEWSDFWSEHTSIHSDPPPAPDVDFGQERVFAFFAGVKPSSCWWARIHNVTLHENVDYTKVDATTYSGEPHAVCAAVITEPHHMVAILAAETEVVFSEAASEGPPPSGAGGVCMRDDPGPGHVEVNVRGEPQVGEPVEVHVTLVNEGPCALPLHGAMLRVGLEPADANATSDGTSTKDVLPSTPGAIARPGESYTLGVVQGPEPDEPGPHRARVALTSAAEEWAWNGSDRIEVAADP